MNFMQSNLDFPQKTKRFAFLASCEKKNQRKSTKNDPRGKIKEKVSKVTKSQRKSTKSYQDEKSKKKQTKILHL